MKTFLALFIVFTVAFAIQCNGQASADYEIFFTANPPSDSVAAWSVYLQGNTNNGQFDIVDGMDYNTILDQYWKADIQNVGQVGEVVYDVTLPSDGQWYVAGIIAYMSSGIKSVVGASGSYRVDKQPGKPGGVGIRKK